MITPKQRELLDFIRAYQGEREVSPCFEEMRVGVGIASKSGIFSLLNGLEKRGYVRRLHGERRAIEIIDRSGSLAAVSTDALIAELARRHAAELAGREAR